MNSFTFIVNPVSGKGIGKKAVKLLHREIRSKIPTYELVLTEREGHATEIARDAPMGTVIAVGGDGTVNEVANGIVGSAKFLGIVPTGSGNDLTKSLNIPSKLSDTIDVLLKGKTIAIDVGSISCSKQPGIGESKGNSAVRYFVNGAGIGLDAAVAEKTRHIRYLTGTTLYVAAVLRTLGKYRAQMFEISVDSVSKASKQLLIAIGNGTCAGGAFYLTPHAKLDDGILDLCYIGDMPIHRILRLMPLVMKGKHIDSEGVSFEKGREINICSDTPFFVHADGEIVGREVSKVDIGILNRKLDVIVG
jgi:YegS/Rv2252/BmrU family lipid kinase